MRRKASKRFKPGRNIPGQMSSSSKRPFGSQSVQQPRLSPRQALSGTRDMTILSLKGLVQCEDLMPVFFLQAFAKNIQNCIVLALVARHVLGNPYYSHVARP